MGTRRSARVLALQALFDMDVNSDDSEERLKSFYRNFHPSDRSLPFFIRLVNGVREHRAEIDSLLDNHSNNWKISRMSYVDRNVMRIAIYELLFCQDIPAKVCINEAVDIGKKFGAEDSGGFINGILDSIHKILKKEEGIDEEITGQIDITIDQEKE